MIWSWNEYWCFELNEIYIFGSYWILDIIVLLTHNSLQYIYIWIQLFYLIISPVLLDISWYSLNVSGANNTPLTLAKRTFLSAITYELPGVWLFSRNVVRPVD